MQHAQALILADGALHTLAPHCDRAIIAGSIRRMKPDVKDVEIVAIPKHVPDGLFSDAFEVDPDFCAVVKRWTKVKGEPTGKYTKRVLPGGMMLDLFIATPETWGSILLIRTGDWQFSKQFMGTMLPRCGYRHRDGSVWKGDVIVPVLEEVDLFRLVGRDFIEPSQRVGPIL